MIYHKFVTNRTLLNKVCCGFQHGAYIGVILYKTIVYPYGSPFLLPYLGYKVTYEPSYNI